MTVQSAIKKVETKLNVKMIKNERTGEYTATYKDHNIGFYDNGGTDSITCIFTKPSYMESDAMTDHFVETFHDNITRAINYLIGFSN